MSAATGTTTATNAGRGRFGQLAISLRGVTKRFGDKVVLDGIDLEIRRGGALKAFLDRFPAGVLAGTAVILAATAAVPEHYLSLDTSGRALVASLEGWAVPSVVYVTPADIVDGKVGDDVHDRLVQALAEAAVVAGS